MDLGYILYLIITLDAQPQEIKLTAAEHMPEHMGWPLNNSFSSYLTKSKDIVGLGKLQTTLGYLHYG